MSTSDQSGAAPNHPLENDPYTDLRRGLHGRRDKIGKRRKCANADGPLTVKSEKFFVGVRQFGNGTAIPSNPPFTPHHEAICQPIVRRTRRFARLEQREPKSVSSAAIWRLTAPGLTPGAAGYLSATPPRPPKSNGKYWVGNVRFSFEACNAANSTFFTSELSDRIVRFRRIAHKRG